MKKTGLEKLRERIQNTDITSKELAKALGYTNYMTVYRKLYAKEGSYFTTIDIIRMQNVLNLTADEVLMMFFDKDDYKEALQREPYTRKKQVKQLVKQSVDVQAEQEATEQEETLAQQAEQTEQTQTEQTENNIK